MSRVSAKGRDDFPWTRIIGPWGRGGGPVVVDVHRKSPRLKFHGFGCPDAGTFQGRATDRKVVRRSRCRTPPRVKGSSHSGRSTKSYTRCTAQCAPLLDHSVTVSNGGCVSGRSRLSRSSPRWTGNKTESIPGPSSTQRGSLREW